MYIFKLKPPLNDMNSAYPLKILNWFILQFFLNVFNALSLTVFAACFLYSKKCLVFTKKKFFIAKDGYKVAATFVFSSKYAFKTVRCTFIFN